MNPLPPLLLLPTEVLHDILRYLLGEDLQPLWFSGTRRLQWLMSEGGALRSLVFWDKTKFTPFLWSFSRITVLFFGIPFAEHTYKRLGGAKLLNLPRSLRRLTANFVGAGLAFTEAFALNPTHFEDLESLEITDLWKKEHTGDQEAVKFGANLPRQLKRLSLSLAENTQVSGEERRLVLKELPETLEWLSCRVHSLQWQVEGDADLRLPGSLTSLRVTPYSGSNLYLLPLLPDSLVELLLKLSGRHATPLKEIPRGLRSLSLVSSNPHSHNRHYTRVSKELLASLPPGLTELTLRGMVRSPVTDAELVAYLPRNLKYLSGFILKAPVSAEIARALPTQLPRVPSTVLLEAIPVLPPSIISLSLAKRQYLIEDEDDNANTATTNASSSATTTTTAAAPLSFAHLPKLQVLSIGELTLEKAVALSILSHLTQLTVDAITSPPSLVMPLLPISLRSLTLAPLTTPELKALELLPPNVTSLHLHGNQNSVRLLLPRWDPSKVPRLTSLAIQNFEFATSEQDGEEGEKQNVDWWNPDPKWNWFSGLPSSLTSLNIRIPYLLQHDPLPHLAKACPLLTTLSLAGPFHTQQTPFKPFPPSITDLHLINHIWLPATNQYLFSVDDISSLPPKLRALTLVSMRVHSGLKSEHLPATLETLYLDYGHVEWFVPRATPLSRRIGFRPHQ